jgi:hypothetical protein
MATSKRAGGSEPGIGVDAFGGGVIDPTKNVLDLTEAANQRQDDLRDLTNRYTDARIRALEQIATLRADHAREIRELDADRLEKIRQVDVLNAGAAADRALVAIQTQATVTATNAETLRAMVSTTAATMATQLDQRMGALTDRIAAVEKSQYSGAGKSEGYGASWGIVLAVVSLIATLITIGVFLSRTAVR